MAIIFLVVLTKLVLSIALKLADVFYDECLLLYVQLKLIFASVNTLLDGFAGLLLFGGQFGTILLLWIVFKCYDLLSIYIYVSVCVISVVFVLIASDLMPSAVKIRTCTAKLVNNKMGIHYCTNRQSTRKYYYYNLWKSQKCVGVRCASFFLVQEGLTISYFQNLVNNLVNAVILIDA